MLLSLSDRQLAELRFFKVSLQVVEGTSPALLRVC